MEVEKGHTVKELEHSYCGTDIITRLFPDGRIGSYNKKGELIMLNKMINPSKIARICEKTMVEIL
jgi:hypothetical protein